MSSRTRIDRVRAATVQVTASPPVEMDCHFESICESCTFFVTTIEFRPTLERQRDDAAAKGQVATLATFGTVWAVLSVGHNLADHVFGQSDHQAANKGAPSATDVADGVSPRQGWGACLGHVASLGVARFERPGSVMVAQLSGRRRWVVGARQVPRTAADGLP
ncbi:hypothetical protein ACFYRC_35215 [Streptomyces sp. NPDC005279]|uniref:hypothetical protein n=1 Tax=Streptomyces sp. NPDC005279 TaxID=3364712 RepID=UPI00368B6A3D